MSPKKISYLFCPDCQMKRVTRREFSDGDGYACDRCSFTTYIEEEGDQSKLKLLQEINPQAEIQMKYNPEEME